MRLWCDYQGDGEIKRREDLRRRQTKPTTTLFVVNFDVENTRERDLERHFEPYGRLVRVQIKRNYAFIQYETPNMASDALKACHMSRFSGERIDARDLSPACLFDSTLELTVMRHVYLPI